GIRAKLVTGVQTCALPIFLRNHDVSVLVWDMLDHLPIGYDIPWAVHAVLFCYGVALLDNALLEPLARACVEEGRDDFMLVIAPRSEERRVGKGCRARGGGR